MSTIKICFAVLAAILLVLGIFHQIQVEREADFERKAEQDRVEALQRYDHDIKAFKQLGRLFQP